jgi:hypothetical protein
VVVEAPWELLGSTVELEDARVTLIHVGVEGVVVEVEEVGVVLMQSGELYLKAPQGEAEFELHFGCGCG